LSKQNGAQALDLGDPLAALLAAAAMLELATVAAPTVGEWLAAAVAAWAPV
jgi:glutamyl-Q tRNA(Asp) synthetase